LDFKGEKQFDVVELARVYGLKCIVYSGNFNKAFINKSIEMGAIAFVSKLGSLDDLCYVIKNFLTIEHYVCSFCKQNNVSNNEFLFPDLKGIEELILDRLLTQTPRKEIAKEFKIKNDTLNTYINRMTTKNNCNLLALIHRYIIWKRSKI
jgi:DNA-binding NarL/FixJ family response regulator